MDSVQGWPGASRPNYSDAPMPADFLWQATTKQRKIEEWNYLNKEFILHDLFEGGNCQDCRRIKKHVHRCEKTRMLVLTNGKGVEGTGETQESYPWLTLQLACQDEVFNK